MLKDKKAVLFDLDGTLADSMWIWTSIDQEYLERFGKEFTMDLQKVIDGLSFYETAVYFKTHYGIPDSLEKIQQDWKDMAREYYRSRIRLKDGAEELIKGLKSRGIKIGLGTSNSRDLTCELLRAHGIYEDFDCILTAAEIRAGKPRPDIYLALASSLGVDPCECLVFEDVLQGIQAGRAAGMEVCEIADERSDWSREEKRKTADYSIDSFREVLREWE